MDNDTGHKSDSTGGQMSPNFSQYMPSMSGMTQYMPSIPNINMPSMPNFSQYMPQQRRSSPWMIAGILLGLIVVATIIAVSVIYSKPKSSESSTSGSSSTNNTEATSAAKPSDKFTWYYYADGVLSEPLQGCSAPDGDAQNWIMKKAYVSGRLPEDIGWKYTEDPNDPDCMRDWTYYDKDYKVIEKNISSITTLNDDKNWCPKPVYATNGKRGVEWDYCG